MNEVNTMKKKLEALRAEQADLEMRIACQEKQEAMTAEETEAKAYRYDRLLEIEELSNSLNSKIHQYIMDYYDEDVYEILDLIADEIITSDLAAYRGEYE